MGFSLTPSIHIDKPQAFLHTSPMDQESQNLRCSGPFGSATLEYPLNFDLRIIYKIADGNLAAGGDFADLLRKTLETRGVQCSLIQSIVKPHATYGRMGARVVVESKTKMDALYAAVAALPGVKAVI